MLVIENCNSLSDLRQKLIDGEEVRTTVGKIEPVIRDNGIKDELEPTTKNDLALIHTEGLDEEIRCTMCTNSMKSDRGCDGGCVVNNAMYKKVMNAIEKRIQSTAKNDLAVREFEEIDATYPPEELCIYPEYKGKPYFGIKYKENGEEIVGYGTYKPEVLSQYLKDYFISTTKNDLYVTPQEPCEDVITRILKRMWNCRGKHTTSIDKVKMEQIIRDELPSVNSQPKTGHWIEHPHEAGPCWEYSRYECSECHEWAEDDSDYCPSCGAKMQEVEDGNK